MVDLTWFGKLLIGFGAIALLLGGLLLGLGHVFSISRLPGDIFVQKGHLTFYFPLVTSIILSLVLTILLNLFFHR
ncbi:MAG: DUF2905 domain-containing protein [Bacillota bacterium]